MSVVAAYITPHPPLIFPEIGGGEEKKIQSTINALNEMADEISNIKPDLIIILSPHSIMYSDYIHISPGTSAQGDMSQYRAPQVKISVDYDKEFVDKLELMSEQNGIPAGTLGEKNPELDHATMIPLRFINEKYTDYKTVRIAPGGISFDELYSFGELIGSLSQKMNKKTVIIGSGDLSHKLKDEGPYGYVKEGPEFDSIICDAIESGDFNKFMNMDPAFEEKAADCGLRAFIILAGTLHKMAVESRLLSYEGPFGVGYAVGRFVPVEENESRDFRKTYIKVQEKLMIEKRKGEDEYVRLARNTVEELAKNHKEYKPDYTLPSSMTDNQAGVFVSIKKDGSLRGCIGTTGPTRKNIGEEIIKNAISASSEDPRFPPIVESELDRLSYSVDVLNEPEPINDKSLLDTEKYGVIVSLGMKRGLLLPNLDGIDSVDEQIQIAMQKAGISPKDIDKVELQRFEVIRHY